MRSPQIYLEISFVIVDSEWNKQVPVGHASRCIFAYHLMKLLAKRSAVPLLIPCDSYHAAFFPLKTSGWISFSRSLWYASWNSIPFTRNLISQYAMNAFNPSPSNSAHDSCSSRIGDDVRGSTPWGRPWWVGVWGEPGVEYWWLKRGERRGEWLGMWTCIAGWL